MHLWTPDPFRTSDACRSTCKQYNTQKWPSNESFFSANKTGQTLAERFLRWPGVQIINFWYLIWLKRWNAKKESIIYVHWSALTLATSFVVASLEMLPDAGTAKAAWLLTTSNGLPSSDNWTALELWLSVEASCEFYIVKYRKYRMCSLANRKLSTANSAKRAFDNRPTVGSSKAYYQERSWLLSSVWNKVYSQTAVENRLRRILAIKNWTHFRAENPNLFKN